MNLPPELQIFGKTIKYEGLNVMQMSIYRALAEIVPYIEKKSRVNRNKTAEIRYQRTVGKAEFLVERLDAMSGLTEVGNIYELRNRRGDTRPSAACTGALEKSAKSD